MLLIALTAIPLPIGPQFTAFPENDFNSIGINASTIFFSPPSIVVTVPASAPKGPPDTGQSINFIPLYASVAATFCVSAGLPLVVSTMIEPSSKSNREQMSSTYLVVGRDKNITLQSLKVFKSTIASVPYFY